MSGYLLHPPHRFADETGHVYPNGVCDCGRVAPLPCPKCYDSHPGKDCSGAGLPPPPPAPPTDWDDLKRRGIF